MMDALSIIGLLMVGAWIGAIALGLMLLLIKGGKG